MLATKEKSHPGFQLPTAALHPASSFAISNTATEFDASLYDFRIGPLCSGYFRDSENGLDYAKNRYHQPGMGRFLSPDPYLNSAGPTNPGSWNRYAYALGDPIKYKDPGGRYACDPDDCADGGSVSAGDCATDPDACVGDEADAYNPNSACYGNYYVATGQETCPGDDSSTAATKTYRTYFLTVKSDCYLVPTNGGPVTREISYQLDFQDNTMSTPMFTNTGVIWEHLTSTTGSIPPAGANSPSSGPPGTYGPDLQSILAGASYQQITQSFTAVINGTSIGLAIDASQFGGWVQSLNIQKYAGYVSINGNTGGQVDPKTGKLIPGTYTPCNN